MELNLNKHKLKWWHLVEMLNKSWEKGRSGRESAEDNSGKLLDQIALIRPSIRKIIQPTLIRALQGSL